MASGGTPPKAVDVVDRMAVNVAETASHALKAALRPVENFAWPQPSAGPEALLRPKFETEGRQHNPFL